MMRFLKLGLKQNKLLSTSLPPQKPICHLRRFGEVRLYGD